MANGVLGGGLIFVVAALLWAAVLVPNWMRQREFRAAEQNALRLQRTLRVLAETSEVPQEVRVEATAKQALAHEKLLRTAQRRQEAEREAVIAKERAEQVRAEIRTQQIKRQQMVMQRAANLRRPAIRGVRALAAAVTVLGILGVLVGASLALAGAGSMMLISCAASAVLGFGTLMLLAPGRVKMSHIAAETVEAAPAPKREAEPASAEPVATGETTAAAEAHQAAQQAAAERIATAQAKARARAARPAELENQPHSILLQEARKQVAAEARAAQQPQASSVPQVEAPAPASTPSPRDAAARRAAAIAKMGVVGDTSEGKLNLDEVLRRRRAG